MNQANARPKIIEQGSHAAAPVKPKPQIDPQDVFLVVGVIALVGGIAAWSRPAAAVVFGLLCFGFVYLIEVAKVRKTGKGRGE